MKAEIISIGDELLVGQVVNTNASWLAAQLNQEGIEVVRIVAIRDDREDILKSLAEASTRADAILITGGLGPTRDDITKLTLCEYFGSELVFHQPSFDNVLRLFSSRGFRIGEENRRQAEIPDNCTPISNLNGTAPGMWFEKDGKIYVSMPGVPFEMKPMVTDLVLPELIIRRKGGYIVHKTVMTQGIGESFLAEIIKDWEENLPGQFKLAYLPQPGMVRLRLTGRGTDVKALTDELKRLSTELVTLIPDYVFGYDDEKPEEVIGKILREAGATLATAESCTGGYIAHLITSIPGSSAYFTGSVVAYSNLIKINILGVKEETLTAHGAVSSETVKEMAEGVRSRFGTDYAIAVSGIAGPDGGTKEKAIGTTWIALAGPNGTSTEKFIFGHNRERNIRLAALAALGKLRVMILSGRA